MKKISYLFFSLVLILASCTDVKKSKEYQTLEAERDSLLSLTSVNTVEMNEMMAVISDVEANFAKIREAEKYISTQSAKSGEMSQDTKSRVNDNFRMIDEILRQNKAQIAELNKKAVGGNKEIVSLKNTIDRLNKEMESSAKRVTELQATLSEKDATIAQLSSDITQIANEAEMQSQKIQAQDAEILEKDKALHTAYYVFGTSDELKEQKILSGGFLQSTKVMEGTFNKDYFLKIDIRDVTTIPLYSGKAKLWSNHPEGTYEFVKGGDGNLTLQISDTQRFWSLTKYMIIEVS
ncbi:MAG: hypothetical protein WCR12_04185 [Dysgonamonadaceae bacterium]